MSNFDEQPVRTKNTGEQSVLKRAPGRVPPSLVGQKFFRLSPIRWESRRANNGQASRWWLCQCDCGNHSWVKTNYLTSGNTKSCGCWNEETRVLCNTKHGAIKNHRPTRLYRIWSSIKRRCSEKCKNPTLRPYYFERGIRVCEEWRNSFIVFQDWALSHGYRDDLEIERKDNDKGYSPDNCEWATEQQQSENRRSVPKYDFGLGGLMTTSEASRRTGIATGTIRVRVTIQGWTPRDAIVPGRAKVHTQQAA